MSPRKNKRVAIYARISVSQEESVSVERQVEAAEQYAAARGMTVVGTWVDDGVSASKSKPEDRAGWRALLDSATPYEAVVIWKVDRLARRVLDFLLADQALQERGAGLIAVEDPVDMTTAQGRAFATMLAVFAQMEADAISARVKAARVHLIKSGRTAGGAVPYGWCTVPNPDGPGKVVAKDPETIGWVRQAAERTLRGETLYSTVKWLDEQGAPLPRTGDKNRKAGSGWAYPMVDRLLRNPILAGHVVFNPGHAHEHGRRGEDVLRGDDGLPVVREDLAVMPVADWRRMVALLEDRTTSPQRRPRALRAKTSSLLSGLVVCGNPVHGDDLPRMWRGVWEGVAGYSCRQCTRRVVNFEDTVVEEFLSAKSAHVRWQPVEEVHEGGAALLPEIEQRLSELASLIDLSTSREDREPLLRQQADLLDERDRRRAESPVTSVRWNPTGLFGDDWAAAQTPEERRAVLGDALHRIVVGPGRAGRHTREKLLERLTFEWKMPEHVGDLDEPGDPDA